MSYFPPDPYFAPDDNRFAQDFPKWLGPLVRSAREGQITQVLPDRRPPRAGETDAAGRPHRASAVLVLFSGDPDAPGPRPPGDASLLLTHRAATLGSHAGQISFPGGGAEEQDADVVDTALREAEEETGLDPDSVDVLAVTGPLYIPVSNYSVYPVLAYWREPMVVHVADEAETTRVMTVPLDELLDPANRFVVRQQMGWQGPAFAIENLVLWGFTAGVFAAASEVGGWDLDWDRGDVRDLEKTLAESANGEKDSWPRREVRAEMVRRMEESNPDEAFRRLGVPAPETPTQNKEDGR